MIEGQSETVERRTSHFASPNFRNESDRLKLDVYQVIERKVGEQWVQESCTLASRVTISNEQHVDTAGVIQEMDATGAFPEGTLGAYDYLKSRTVGACGAAAEDYLFAVVAAQIEAFLTLNNLV